MRTIERVSNPQPPQTSPATDPLEAIWCEALVTQIRRRGGVCLNHRTWEMISDLVGIPRPTAERLVSRLARAGTINLHQEEGHVYAHLGQAAKGVQP